MPANWFNRFTKWWASSGTLQDPTDPQAAAGWSYIGQAPPTVEQFNSVQQWNDQKDNYLFNQIGAVLTWGGQTATDTNPNTLRDAISGKMKIILTASTNYYVDLAGNDSTGNGTVGNPWRTIQFAVNWITNHIDAAGFNVNIQLKTAGTYAQAYFGIPINGNFIITGDKLNPRNYIVKNLDGAAITATQSAIVILIGISLEATGQATGAPDYKTVGHGMYAARGAVVYYDAVALGPCSHVQIVAESGATIYPLNGLSTTLSVYGGGQSFATGNAAGSVVLQAIPTTFTNNPNYTAATVQAAQAGTINAIGWAPTGTVTGPKWSIFLNGILVTNVAGANIPGSTAGQVVSGGQIQ
jgi:hypothetical protein